jgi:ParB/RepB/Spo0J family partition protein
MSIIDRPALEGATVERPAIEGAQFIPLGLIQPNPKQPRKRFDPAALTELADSIERFGVLQPILARPITGAKPGQPQYEIVAGERRWRASTLLAKRRGEESIAVVPTIVREMTDFEVLELATVENLHRKDLHPLEEAEGYEALLLRPLHGGEFTPPRMRGYSVEELATRVGKSKSYILGRLKLCALIPEAREAFFGDQLNASVALLIARMPGPVQAQALPIILQGWGGEPYSFRQARDLLERDFMLELAHAPFSTDSPLLLPAAGACPARPAGWPARPPSAAGRAGSRWR